MKHEVRVIAGQYRGKKITFPEADGLRPTPDRVRETLFNWLMHDIRDARCLDAFAGSGALGIEAFSRGAKEVVFIEQNRKVFSHLHKTILSFNSPKLSVVNANAIEVFRQSNLPFDIIFLDPPFHSTLLSACLVELSQSNLLKPNGFLYIESDKDIQVDPLRWHVLNHKKAGSVYYCLIQHHQ